MADVHPLTSAIAAFIIPLSALSQAKIWRYKIYIVSLRREIKIILRIDMEVKDKIKRYSTPQECAEVLRGMINLKQQWLEYAKKRETELAIS